MDSGGDLLSLGTLWNPTIQAVVQGIVKLKCYPSFGLFLFPPPARSGRWWLLRLPLPSWLKFDTGLSLTSHPTTWKTQARMVTKADPQPSALRGGKGGAVLSPSSLSLPGQGISKALRLPANPQVQGMASTTLATEFVCRESWPAKYNRCYQASFPSGAKSRLLSLASSLTPASSHPPAFTWSSDGVCAAPAD